MWTEKNNNRIIYLNIKFTECNWCIQVGILQFKINEFFLKFYLQPFNGRREQFTFIIFDL